MKTMYIDISVPRIVITRILGKIWPGAYFSSFSPFHFLELADPPLPGKHWVRVNNRLCGICGSDLHQLLVDSSLDIAPVALPSNQRIYLGHEMVGEVIEVSPGESNFSIGDRVVRWGRMDDCLARNRIDLCDPCSRGHRVLCEFASEPRDFLPVGGGFGNSFIAPETSLVKVKESLTNEQAIFTEPLAVAIHAAYRQIPKPGEKVLILGVGTIGFLLLQVLRYLQPHCHIMAMAQFPWQQQLAYKLGADDVLLTSQDDYKNVSERTGAKLYAGRANNQMLIGGYDIVFDVVGIPETLNNAIRWTKAFGTVILVGVYLHRMKIDLSPIWYQEVNLKGAIGHDVVPWKKQLISTFDLAMLWMNKGIIETEVLLTHRFALDEYKAAFETALDKKGKKSIKVVFDIS